MRRDVKLPLSKDDDNGCDNVVISRYCNNFATTPSLSAWKVCVHIPEIKLVRMVWIFREKIYRQMLTSSTQPIWSFQTSKCRITNPFSKKGLYIVLLTYTILHVVCDHKSWITRTLKTTAIVLTGAIQAHVWIRTFVFVCKENANEYVT